MSEGRRHEREVAYRALCLGALLYRLYLELKARVVDVGHAPRYRQINDQLLGWVEHEGLVTHLTLSEREQLSYPFGHWPTEWTMKANTHSQRLAVLLWALHRLEHLPHYDASLSFSQVLRPLDILHPAIDFVWCARLRPLAALLDCREQADLWQWRTQAEELERMGLRAWDGRPMRAIIRQEVAQAQAQGRISAVLDGDFRAFGKPYADLSAEQHQRASAISAARAQSIHWVCDDEAPWE